MKRLLVVILALVLLFTVHLWFISAIESTSLYRLQVKYLHWRYMHQAIFLLGAPLLALFLLRRSPWEYALSWNRHVLAGIVVIMGLTLALPIAVDIAAGKLRLVNADVGYIVSTLVFQIIFSGCGEELYFRGMYQGEVDRVCGKTFRIGGTHFGFGAIVGALAFGLAHLELFNFMEWGFLDLKTLVAVCLIGLFLGFVREFVGCIFIVGFLHASFDTYRSLVQPSVPGRVVHVAAIGLVCYLVFSRRIHAGAATAKPSTGGDAQGPVLQPERSTAN